MPLFTLFLLADIFLGFAPCADRQMLCLYPAFGFYKRFGPRSFASDCDGRRLLGSSSKNNQTADGFSWLRDGKTKGQGRKERNLVVVVYIQSRIRSNRQRSPSTGGYIQPRKEGITYRRKSHTKAAIPRDFHVHAVDDGTRSATSRALLMNVADEQLT
ncbi:hypothetical protein GHT06_022362 [Daphnia sinensis]|uniref:Secreted protein n=1 Tax=Daphnia sinensis TaxID=1820382 RepID=A0AAD5KX07_9CRUS|nr:hypothetical protein GHT06_022362 [Daphnia sinensis]